MHVRSRFEKVSLASWFIRRLSFVGVSFVGGVVKTDGSATKRFPCGVLKFVLLICGGLSGEGGVGNWRKNS